MFDRKRLMVGAAALATAGAIVVPTFAGATGATAPEAASLTIMNQEAEEDGAGFRGRHHRRFHALQAEALAEALGLDTEDVVAAITELRADFTPPTFEGDRPTVEELEALRAERQQAIADALGVTVAELEAATEELREEFPGRGGRHGHRGGGGGGFQSSFGSVPSGDAV